LSKSATTGALLVEAVLWLAAARVALIAVPFPVLARRFGDFVPPTDPRATGLTRGSAREAELAAEIGWAVTRAARNAARGRGRSLPAQGNGRKLIGQNLAERCVTRL
jgi:hypothetical protein